MNHIAALLRFATLSASRALYRLAYWVGVGAQSSPTVDRLLKQAAKKAA